MKRKTVWLMPAIACLCIGAAQAAGADKTNIVRDYTDTVAPADQQAYESGIKSYNECLAQHGFKYSWATWVHETGDTYSYSYTTDPVAWADFDAMHETSKACDATLRAQVNPHLKGESSAFMQGDPELSNLPAATLGTPALIEVTYFKLKPGQRMAFIDAVKKIYAAAKKSKWAGHSMTNEVIHGGAGAPDFLLVSPSKNWAELGTEMDPTVWKMLEGVYGKAEADAIRKTIRDSVQDSSSHVDSYNAELSYKAAGK
ncbi:MAG: hypothetical protein ABIQ36_03650 [Rhodanobacter sp.]